MDKICMIKSGKDLVRVNPGEVVYLKAEGNTCQLYTARKKGGILLYGAFKHWADVLSEFLMPIQRGLAVNPFYINKVVGGEVFFQHRDEELSFFLAKVNEERLRERLMVYA